MIVILTHLLLQKWIRHIQPIIRKRYRSHNIKRVKKTIRTKRLTKHKKILLETKLKLILF